MKSASCNDCKSSVHIKLSKSMSAEAVLHPGIDMLAAFGYGFKDFISKMKYVDGYFHNSLSDGDD